MGTPTTGHVARHVGTLRGPSIRIRSPGRVRVVRDDFPAPDPSETFDVTGADPDPFDRSNAVGTRADRGAGRRYRR